MKSLLVGFLIVGTVAAHGIARPELISVESDNSTETV